MICGLKYLSYRSLTIIVIYITNNIVIVFPGKTTDIIYRSFFSFLLNNTRTNILVKRHLLLSFNELFIHFNIPKCVGKST